MGNSIKLESAKILDMETHLYERGMKGVIDIRAHEQSLNNGRSSHKLKPVAENPEIPPTTQAGTAYTASAAASAAAASSSGNQASL